MTFQVAPVLLDLLERQDLPHLQSARYYITKRKELGAAFDGRLALPPPQPQPAHRPGVGVVGANVALRQHDDGPRVRCRDFDLPQIESPALRSAFDAG